MNTPAAGVESQRRLAVLIDADNARPDVVRELLAEVAKYGVLSVRRIYGDFTKPTLNGWKAALLEHSIQPFQQFAYTSGKNASYPGEFEIQDRSSAHYVRSRRATPGL